MDELFDLIIGDIKRRPIRKNRYRKAAGLGRSQTFGVVDRRSMPPDYAATCFKRPYLYKLLLDFGKAFVTTPFNAITVNQNYLCSPHRDLNNNGLSSLVAFGDFVGGELRLHGGDQAGDHDVKGRILIADFSKVTHSVCPFTGDRFSLVYYFTPAPAALPPPSVRLENDKWYFYRGEQRIDRGLPHPLRKNFVHWMAKDGKS